jgi:hypothetical protein
MKLCHFQDVNMNNFENKQQFQKKIILIPMVEIKSQFTNEFPNLTLYLTMISTTVIGVVLSARIRFGCSQDVKCM